jgi:beta-1,4-mannosyl-glycoprotein beta-1,4-N-acetylglucosaminyltransferase
MIVDCFTFFKEFEILEIRLNTLNKYVDKFIITESEETFTGIPKTLYFEENKKRFEKFLDKIIHIKLPKIPDHLDPYKGQVNWAREYYQGNASMEYIKNFNAEDIIMISDCDEIPDLSKVNLNEIDQPKVFLNNYFTFRFNLMAVNNEKTIERIEGNPQVDTTPKNPWKWFGTTISKQKYISKDLFWGRGSLREKRQALSQIDGGWHFSSCMSNKDIINKIASYSHANEYGQINNEEIINKYISENKDFCNYNLRDMKLIEATTEYLPEYLVENKEKYSHLFK